MTTRKQIAAAFRIARKSIANNPTGFICNALPFTTEAGKAAERIIHERMGYVERGPSGYSEGPFTLQSWLRLHGHWLELEYVPSHIMQAYRLRWLDALIEEFSAPYSA